MNEVIRAAAQLQAVCEQNRWRYCFIGGLAVLRCGEPRETIDVDLTLLTGFEARPSATRAQALSVQPARMRITRPAMLAATTTVAIA